MFLCISANISAASATITVSVTFHIPPRVVLATPTLSTHALNYCDKIELSVYPFNGEDAQQANCLLGDTSYKLQVTEENNRRVNTVYLSSVLNASGQLRAELEQRERQRLIAGSD